MKLIKPLILLITIYYLGFFLTSTSFAQNNNRTLKAGADYAYYPYEYVNEFNQPAGFDIDILKAVISELNMDYEIESGNWFSIKQKLEKGELDLLAGMYYHPSRADKVNFSMPYIIITHSIFVNKGDYWQSLKDVRDQKNLKVVVENSSILHKYLTTAGISSDRILPVENQLDALRILSESSNTCALLPELQGKYIAQKNGFKNVITVGLPILPREYSIAVNKNDSLLLNQINDAITKINNNGIYEKIYKKWFGEYDQYFQAKSKYSTTEIVLFLLLILISTILIYQILRWNKYKKFATETISIEEFEKQKLSDNLRKNETLLRKITENSPYPIAIVAADGVFNYVNRRFEDTFSITRQEANYLESWIHNSILEKDEQDYIKSLIQKFQSSRLVKNDSQNLSIQAVNFTLKSGRSKNIIIKISSLGDGQIMLFFEDVTESQKQTLKLQKAKTKAESADQQKTSFLANISHEIRTPMNSILGFSSLLSEDELTREEKDLYSKLIRKNGNILLLLIQDIIDISKIEAGILTIEPKLENLHSIIIDAYNNIKEDFGVRIPDPIKFNLNLPENIEHQHYFVRVDKSRMAQVLNNILNNAFKYTDKGSIEFGLRELPNNKIRIFVSDTGIGIKEEDFGIVFERFSRVESKEVRLRHGTGLGLAISYQILKLFGSELLMESEFNKGSIFFFDLPYYEGQGETIDTKVLAYSSLNASNYNWSDKTILLIEDNKENANYIVSSLKKTHCHIIVFETGQEAIEYIQSNQKIDLIILDWLLPDMNGNTIVDHARASSKSIPIIVVTALALIEDQLEIKQNNIDEYMSKPVEKNYLLHRINHFLIDETNS